MKCGGRASALVALSAAAWGWSGTISPAETGGQDISRARVQEHRTAKAIIPGVRANNLLGRRVENPLGDRLGTVRDLIIDTRSSRVEYVIISSGGFLGIWSHQKIAPASLLNPATAKRNVAALQLPPENWRNAPEFNRNSLQQLARPKVAERIHKYYGQTFEPGPTAGAPRLRLASDVMGRDVVNGIGEDMGKIADLLVELPNRQTAFAILKPAVLLAPVNQLFAVPLNGFELRQRGFVLMLPTEKFTGARFLSSSDLRVTADPGPPEVFRLPPDLLALNNAAPDNTARNLGDWRTEAVTPLDQSEDAHDLRMASSIRLALIRDTALSVEAKNVKVIAVNGRVFLRGPVHTSREKREIGEVAQRAAGAGEVEDFLEVTRY